MTTWSYVIAVHFFPFSSSSPMFVFLPLSLSFFRVVFLFFDFFCNFFFFSSTTCPLEQLWHNQLWWARKSEREKNDFVSNERKRERESERDMGDCEWVKEERARARARGVFRCVQVHFIKFIWCQWKVIYPFFKKIRVIWGFCPNFLVIFTSFSQN